MERAKFHKIKKRKKKCINILECIILASGVLFGVTVIVMLTIHYLNK